MKILLTGANGFLGKYLRAYLQQHHTLETLGRVNGCDYICDLSNDVPVLSNNLDVVVHAAGKAHLVPRTEEEAREFFRVNHEGTVRLLQALENQSLSSFILISSVAVYGLEEGDNINERYPLNATDPYGRSKIMAEKAVMEWCTTHKVPCTILRLPLLIGKDAPGNLKAMVDGIKNGLYFDISKGTAKKSMVLVNDIPLAVEQAIGKTGIFNLTDGYHPSFGELSEHIARQVNRKIKSIPYWVAVIAAKLGDVLGKKAPLNSHKLRKISTSLTFDDSLARLSLQWKPYKVLDKFTI